MRWLAAVLIGFSVLLIGAIKYIPANNIFEKCFTLNNPADTDDNVPLWSPSEAITVLGMHCRVQGGTSVTGFLSDGTNALDTMVCSTGGQGDDGSIANATFTADERFEYDQASNVGGPTWLNFCWTYATQ